MASRARRGPKDEGMFWARKVARWTPAGRRMKPEEKRAWRKYRLEQVLANHGIHWHDRYWDVLTDQMIREEHKSDAGRYYRAYGSSRDRRRRRSRRRR